jgi:hypothetical protein
MFWNQLAFKFMDIETIVLGFFYMFIYKDFAIREIVYKFSETVQDEKSLNAIFLAKIKSQYDIFIMNDFAQWMNLILSIEVFQSYSSIVHPYEVISQYWDANSARFETLESNNYQIFL